MKNVYMQAPSGEVFTTANPEFHKDCKRLSAAAGKEARKEYARATLRKMITPGSVVNCVLRHRASSGMSRRISLFIVIDGETRGIDHWAADATGNKLSDAGGIVMSGCGMDMGFALVYALGFALWPNGTPTPHGTRNGVADSAGGYAIKHNWL